MQASSCKFPTWCRSLRHGEPSSPSPENLCLGHKPMGQEQSLPPDSSQCMGRPFLGLSLAREPDHEVIVTSFDKYLHQSVCVEAHKTVIVFENQLGPDWLQLHTRPIKKEMLEVHITSGCYVGLCSSPSANFGAGGGGNSWLWARRLASGGKLHIVPLSNSISSISKGSYRAGWTPSSAISSHSQFSDNEFPFISKYRPITFPCKTVSSTFPLVSLFSP